MGTRTYTAVSGTNNFSDAAKWDGGVSVPSAGDDLVIAGGSDYILLRDADDTTQYGAVTINASTKLDLKGRTFLTGQITNNGTLMSSVDSATNYLGAYGIATNTGGKFEFTSASTYEFRLGAGGFSAPNEYYRATSNRGALQQDVLALRFAEGLDAREIGKILDKNAGAVRVLQHRALKELYALWTAEEATGA